MQIAVLIERLSDQRFRARSGEPLRLSSEGDTAEEAVQSLRLLIAGEFDQGSRLVALDVPSENPWRRLAGSLPDDSLTESWERAMEEYRRQADAAETA